MNAIVAVYSDWGIGFEGKQPIVIAEDRRFFSEMTGGGVIIAGRKTFEEFSGRLSNRKNIILTQDKDFAAEGVIVAHSVDDVLAEITGDTADRIFILGGAEIFRLFMPMCTTAYVTKIEATPESDAFFPNLDELPDWSLTQRGAVNESNGVRYSFNIYRYKHVAK